MLPPILARHLSANHAIRIIDENQIQGGSINQAACINTNQGKFFLKWIFDPLPQMFALEAAGLANLRATNTTRTPNVIAFQDSTPDHCPAYLLLEWIPQSVVTNAGMEILGHQLAALHRCQSANLNFGLALDNYIGSTPQINTWSRDWSLFFRDHRLTPQIQRAAKNNLLPIARHKALDQLLSHLDHWLPTDAFTTSLVHGDLWRGNILQSREGEPILIDPAVYYAHREVDIAFSELFGGFPPIFYSAYNHAWPLDSGYKERRDLYNVYHLLNHLNLFGETYGTSIDTILRQLVGLPVQ